MRRDEALRGIDLDVHAGETVALVGETGAGKSTIVKLVARFHDPTAGRVLIDGVPLTDIDLGVYRRRLGYVPQEPFLFSGTMRDNIAYGRPSATDAEVEAAARAVGAHDVIAALPGGYRHRVTERGRSLSSGQRQLVCLARAHLVDPAILLLDEATANLDLATEARVQQAMGVVAAGRTTLVVAHRLQTARKRRLHRRARRRPDRRDRHARPAARSGRLLCRPCGVSSPADTRLNPADRLRGSPGPAGKVRPMADKITANPDGTLNVSDEPIIPFIEGDGTGVDIWPAAKHVLDSAAAKHGKTIAWKEVLAGQKAFDETGDWLPQDTVDTFREYLIGIKGPLTTPIGGGFRSLNVALRQILDLYVCLRPVRYFSGVPEPGQAAGAGRHGDLPREHRGHLRRPRGRGRHRRCPQDVANCCTTTSAGTSARDSGIGIKPVSEMGSKRLIRAAINYAKVRNRKSVTLVHKGNIMKFTEGAFRNWGYELVREEFADSRRRLGRLRRRTR